MTVRKPSFGEDLETFYKFAGRMKRMGAAKVMVSRGDGVDYVVEFEEKPEDEKAEARDCHAIGFCLGDDVDSDEFEDD